MRAHACNQKEMIARGAGGSLSLGYELYVPISRLDGLEPRPANAESEDGEYHPGRKITVPIEVTYDYQNDVYIVYAGNHRIAQAVANGQTHILAFVEPDLSVDRRCIGDNVKEHDPDYHLFAPEPFVMPVQAEIEEVLRQHPLVHFGETIRRAFVVGSFAKGEQNDQSDLDVLLEVEPLDDWSADELENHYRQGLRQYFVKHDIRGKMDSVHPQWCGRRVDLYLTYDADLEDRPKIIIENPESSNKPRKLKK